MTIDKQKLQSLLWSEVASWKADCGEWKQNAEALGEFLGEKTVEEVALELLAENERLQSAARTLGHLRYTNNGAELWKPPLGEKPDFSLIDQLSAEVDSLTREADRQSTIIEAYRKDAERYRWLRHGHSGYIEVVEWIGPHATGMIGEELDALVDTAMAKAVQP
ncbi:hypothetical protein ACIOZM_08325 [Pseudomonas sp. NPDC087346]|uniref:hypothetical protein n=1 Tax=Pseudomonas sp. NPDC087346 TaxID=3364438 RepID=UPI00382AFE55